LYLTLGNKIYSQHVVAPQNVTLYMIPAPDLPTLSSVALVLTVAYLALIILAKFIASRIAHKMVPLTTAQCREAIITAAVKASVNGTSACAPDGSNVQVTFTACPGAQEIWLAFFNQIKVAFCYIFGQLSTIFTTLTTLQDEIDAIQNSMRTPGAVTVSLGPNAGTGSPSATIAGNDNAMVVTVNTTADAGSGGKLCTVNFLTPYATFPIPVITYDATSTAGNAPTVTPKTNGSGFDVFAGIGGPATYIFDIYCIGGT
jgi:hypothetical protein